MDGVSGMFDLNSQLIHVQGSLFGFCLSSWKAKNFDSSKLYLQFDYVISEMKEFLDHVLLLAKFFSLWDKLDREIS